MSFHKPVPMTIETDHPAHQRPVLVTGATGYVGGRLIPRLLESGYHVRAIGRSLRKIGSRPWAHHPRLASVEGDLMDRASLENAMAGCGSAFYLVHSMDSAEEDFEAADRKAAENMVGAAAAVGLERIVYLGGLGETQHASVSPHLKSRHEVAEILQSGSVPTTVLRAAMLLGSGSASFEILRYLVDRLPIMFLPRWANTPCQPIAIRNVLTYLEGCLAHEATIGKTFDIGGPNILSYRQLIKIYAEEANLPRRALFPMPFLTPLISAYLLQFVTPVPASIAIPLFEGLRTPVVCRNNDIRAIIPQRLLSCRETMGLALTRIQQERVETSWSDAGALFLPEWTYLGDAEYAGGTIVDCSYRVFLKTTVEDLWHSISRIGGVRGWYFLNSLWRIRGDLDRLFGGIGLQRGRRDPSRLQIGDALDFWRVLEAEAPHRLLLLAEMKLPGEALLEFRITALDNGEVELKQIARFLPRGLGGILYWYAMMPFHAWIFGGMLRAIAKSIDQPILRGPERFFPDDSLSDRPDINP
ncbi:MAG: SDR family oxidoreductase [Desulfobacterales bacterium]